MHWEIKYRVKKAFILHRREEIINHLLSNRNIKGKRQKDEFINPLKPENLTPLKVKINSQHLKKAIARIKTAIKNQENIVVYGDYDADGICATAILWEALHALGANVLPFIPHREKHGYGLSKKGIDDLIKVKQGPALREKPSLIITVDNGIVAHKVINYAKTKGIDVIISDHHEKSGKVPNAIAIIHTTQLAGAGVAWIFAKEIISSLNPKLSVLDSLDLATIGTVADMMPLTNANRSIVKHGLINLRNTKRIGLLKLFKEAAIDPRQLETYHINFVIAPRLNAMGRLQHAIESLRLLCTKDPTRAKKLAQKVGSINRQRQELTKEMLDQAREIYLSTSKKKKEEKVIIIDHEAFHEGVIGLIAGRMVEEFYRPTIILARGEKYSKASARSISGFNIIESIRKTENLLIDVGGHPMAAGFTIESVKINSFRASLNKIANNTLTDKHLEKQLSIDCEINLSDISWKLYKEIKKLEPFGIDNPRPTFAINDIQVLEAKAIGKEKNHLKILLPSNIKSQPTIPALWFTKGELADQLPKEISLAFSLNENVWRDKRELQLRIKDISDNFPSRICF